MIAVPRDDGGVTVYGSLQCPYYVHTALKRALALDDSQAVVVQAETGGGFGGKEEYPSMLAIHAALLARAVGRPVRMIYDRHEDIVATTKRHPAIVTHRTGVTRDGRLVAQDIEIVMDAGAYCDAVTGGPVAGHDPRRRPVRLPERPDPLPGDGDEHAAERGDARLRGAADRVRRRDAREPDRRGARALAGRAAAALGVPRRRRDGDRPGAARERWGARGARAGSRGLGVRARPRADGDRARTRAGATAHRGSGSRSAGTARDSPGAARRGWRAWRGSSWRPTAGSAC